jgi:hypothetical protein
MHSSTPETPTDTRPLLHEVTGGPIVLVPGASSRGKRRIDPADRLRAIHLPKNADHHVQHIYAKIGVTTRAGAAVFAMEHDLIQAPERGEIG